MGAIAVVVTLLYLARQMRDSNRETRAATLQSTMHLEMEVMSKLLENAAVWEKVVTGMPLEKGEETRRGILLFNLLMTETESRFHQFEAGYLDPAAWERRIPAVRWAVGNPIYSKWRSSPGALSRSESFLNLLDETIGRAAQE